MADGFDIHIDGDRAEQLKAAAEAAGKSPADFALGLLDAALSSEVAEDDRRWAEYQQTGEGIGAEEWLGGLREAVATARKP